MDTCYSRSYVVTTHLLMVLSMGLYAFNYIVLKIFNENNNAFLFSFLRSIMSIPLVPLLLVLGKRSSKPDPKNIDNENNSDFDRTAYVQMPNQLFYNNNSEDTIKADKERLEVVQALMEEETNLSMLEKMMNWFKLLRLRKEAVPGIFMASLSGAIRQMVVPVALMFTSAQNAGIIQPSVPVFTALLSYAIGLETGSLLTALSIMTCALGLSISGEVWNFRQVDIGFYMLLLVPLSKGLQVIGLQMASKYHKGFVVQLYQILGLIGFVIPVAGILELAFYCQFSFRTFASQITSLTSIAWLCVLYSTIGVILICWKIQIMGVQVIGSIGVCLYQCLQPVFAFMFAAIFLREPMKTPHVIGAIVVILGLLIFQFDKFRIADSRVSDNSTRIIRDPITEDPENGISHSLLSHTEPERVA